MTTTPHRPDATVYRSASATHTASVASGFQPSITELNFTMASMTHPITTQFFSSPWYSALKPRSAEAGRPA